MRWVAVTTARIGVLGCALTLFEALCPSEALEGWSFWLLSSTIEELRDRLIDLLSGIRIELPDVIGSVLIYTAFYTLVCIGDKLTVGRRRLAATITWWHEQGLGKAYDLGLPAFSVIAISAALYVAYGEIWGLVSGTVLAFTMAGETSFAERHGWAALHHRRLWQIIAIAVLLLAVNAIV